MILAELVAEDYRCLCSLVYFVPVELNAAVAYAENKWKNIERKTSRIFLIFKKIGTMDREHTTVLCWGFKGGRPRPE